MYKYNAKKYIEVNGKGYNPGDIIVSENPIEGLEEEEQVSVKNDLKKSVVDIIFVRFNLKIIEDRAIEKVKQNTLYPNYKITDFDNFETKHTLSKLWNKLIEESDADYICLLNTDAYVTKGWLTEIMIGFNDKQVAAVGPSGDNVGGIQREIGTIKLAQQYRGKYKECIGKDTLSGFCLILRKSAWKEAGGFPEEVPFYGGEHALLVSIRELGYKLLWAQGAFVYHLGGASVKKEKSFERLRKEGQYKYHKWLVPRIPILFLTYNRLDYTKKSLKCLLDNTPGNEIIVFDNCSTDGTQEWLRGLKSRRLKIIYNNENIGIAGAMNEFFKMTKNKEYVAKVDNDTLIPKEWLETLVAMSEHYKVDVLQPKHHILNRRYKTFDDWMRELKGDHRIRFSDYVGGSGILIRRALIDSLIPKSSAMLGGWTQWQKRHPDLKKVFCKNLEIELLDMENDNKFNFEKYPNYYVEVGRRVIDSKPLTVKTTFETIITILSRLDEKFAYTRYGDGELMMMENTFKGRDITQFNSPKFAKELLQGFKINDKNYLIGISADTKNEKEMVKGLFGRFENDKRLQNIVKTYYSDKIFYSPVAFHYFLAFYPEMLVEIVNALNKRKLGFVGGSHLKGLKKVFNIKRFVTTPKAQAYNKINSWYPKVKKMAEKVDIILMAIGPTAKVVQKKLWEEDVSTIDIGSVAGAIAGDKTDGHTWIRLAQDTINQFRKNYYD